MSRRGFEGFDQCSTEQLLKRAPGWLDYIGDEIPTLCYIGIISETMK